MPRPGIELATFCFVDNAEPTELYWLGHNFFFLEMNVRVTEFINRPIAPAVAVEQGSVTKGYS